MTAPTYPMRQRIRHDADELRRLADWLAIADESLPRTAEDADDPSVTDAVALDYYRLASRLDTMAWMVRDFANILTRPIP